MRYALLLLALLLAGCTFHWIVAPPPLPEVAPRIAPPTATATPTVELWLYTVTPTAEAAP